MFEEITQQEALKAIKQLIKEDNLRSTTYAVWWKGKLISPSAIISEHYKLVGNPINRDSFDTSQAQEALLKLGFPIVDTSRDDNFFTEKELKTFEVLIARKDYDSSNGVDINIGNFLKEIVWTKTKIWAEKLEQKGWQVVSKRRGWNTRHQKKGFQTYKQYAWCSLRPENEKNKLLFFTVGVGTNGDLEYKIDIQWNDTSFTQAQKDTFWNLREKNKAGFQYIKKENINNLNWKTLVEKSDGFFTKHLETYTEVYYSLWPERRLMRLVYNDNNWQVPIERYWNNNWQGRSDKAHHDQYGFGFEEWLFNSRYHINGFQYGYVRGIDTMPRDAIFINELYLYTLDSKTNQKLLVAKLNNVNLYRDESDIDEEVLKIFEDHRGDMLEELSQVKADTSLLRKIPLLPNISFDLEESIIYEESILLPEDFLKIHRFIPNKIEGYLDKVVNEIDDFFKDPRLDFKKGNGTGLNSYTQNIVGGKRNVNRTHADITNDLYDYLMLSDDYKNHEISAEKTRVGNNLVDCATKKDDILNLFEVKTANTVLACIRQALGQILEYALLDTSIDINQLVIIGPAKPNERDLNYFESLKKTLNLPLNYWSYSFEEKEINKKFIHY